MEMKRIQGARRRFRALRAAGNLRAEQSRLRPAPSSFGSTSRGPHPDKTTAKAKASAPVTRSVLTAAPQESGPRARARTRGARVGGRGRAPPSRRLQGARGVAVGSGRWGARCCRATASPPRSCAPARSRRARRWAASR